MVTALRLGREDVTRGDRKLVNAAIKELRYAFGVFAPLSRGAQVSMFGSARTRSITRRYRAAHDFAVALAAHDWMIMTGAGPGIMQAGLEGAGAANSFGVNIVLPFEQAANVVIGGDPKLVNFRYFFTRKLTFVKESHAICVAPGGFGTLDEMFEALTLMQTGKSFLVPVVLLDEPNGDYWEHRLHFVREELLADGYISPADLDFLHVTHDPLDAVAHIRDFYSTYHSMRWVGTASWCGCSTRSTTRCSTGCRSSSRTSSRAAAWSAPRPPRASARTTTRSTCRGWRSATTATATPGCAR